MISVSKLNNYLIYFALIASLGLVSCDNAENKRLKAELATFKNAAEQKKTIVQGPINEYGVAPGLASVRTLLAKPELKGILIQEDGITQEQASQALQKITVVTGIAVGMPQVGLLNKDFFDTSIKLVNQIKHDSDTGVYSKAYADRYYSKDYSYIVVNLASALLKEGLIIIEAADTSTGCIIKAQASKHKFFSLPQEYVFVIQPSDHGIHIFGASITKHQLFSLDQPEKSLNKILDKVG